MGDGAQSGHGGRAPLALRSRWSSVNGNEGRGARLEALGTTAHGGSRQAGRGGDARGSGEAAAELAMGRSRGADGAPWEAASGAGALEAGQEPAGATQMGLAAEVHGRRRALVVEAEEGIEASGERIVKRSVALRNEEEGCGGSG
ncbi:hypothetical protein TRIUR3_32987 [Triticum urartu]|uniref:Uncharacterized protein n=1 Tax=Triticum urartu TaxID=4572 RepID=M7YRS6_TRIUA|nr:hypothetical protein TRIUR3_32987 [Triticum urartu]